ncbi:hypothetical protein OsJ_11457 [Oryza sativa Japonica Group]|uniref:Uncharacterized protein n=1 Tax=Oryza sativa subsp. japonica TaxID=39947 RepID=B9F9B4_ORYSJ|nr:hypothetical protein OsJ_11457 [Oryza sativa Japonica Group]
MESPPHPLLLLLTLLVAAGAASAGADDLVAELQSLRSRSPSGVIHLTDTSITRFLSAPAPRPYSVLVFFDAASLHSKTDLHLPQLRREFALLSASFLAHNPASADLFFADIEFSESQHSFAQFGVNSLPHVRLVRPEHTRLAGSEQMDQSHFSRLADSMAEFVESRTGLEVGPIVRPPLVSRNQMILLVILFLVSIPFLIKRIMDGETLFHDRRVWMAGALFIYFFSVSGGDVRDHQAHADVHHRPVRSKQARVLLPGVWDAARRRGFCGWVLVHSRGAHDRHGDTLAGEGGEPADPAFYDAGGHDNWVVGSEEDFGNSEILLQSNTTLPQLLSDITDS